MKYIRPFLSAMAALLSWVCHRPVPYACGHKDDRRFFVVIHCKDPNQDRFVYLREGHLKLRHRCRWCEQRHIMAHSFHCPGCGAAIVPGDKVFFGDLPAAAVMEDGSVLICGSCGGDRSVAGFWSDRGLLPPNRLRSFTKESSVARRS